MNPASPKSGSIPTHKALDVDGSAAKEGGANNLPTPAAVSDNTGGSFL